MSKTSRIVIYTSLVNFIIVWQINMSTPNEMVLRQKKFSFAPFRNDCSATWGPRVIVDKSFFNDCDSIITISFNLGWRMDERVYIADEVDE